MKKIAIGCSTLVLAMAAVGVAKADYTLTILHINDLHSRIESIGSSDSTCSAESETKGECFGGIARVKAAIDMRRDALQAEGKNVIVLDAGDQYQGSLFYTTYKGDEVVEFSNAIGFDAMAVGNHEFDDGPEGLLKLIEGLNFPILSGNTDTIDEPLLAGKLKGAITLEIGGQKIGIVSVLAEDTDETASPGDGVRFIVSEDYLKGAVDGLESSGVNKIIALTHVGVTRDIEIAAAVNGIDAIVGGHSHTLFSNTVESAPYSYPYMIKNPSGVEVPIVSAYAYSKYLGELEITFDDDGNVKSAVGDTLLLDKNIVPDEAIMTRIAELNAPLEELKNTIIGETTATIDGSRETCRLQECEMGNLITDAMLHAVKNQGITIALMNGGSIRASFDEGELSMGEVISVLPFQNTLATFEISGSILREALENGVSEWDSGAGRFLQVGGIRYTWDRTAEAGNRIVSVDVNEDGAWVPLDDDRAYMVAGNNYIRGGGDGFAMFMGDDKKAYDYGPGLDQLLADLIAENGGKATPYLDGRISEK